MSLPINKARPSFLTHPTDELCSIVTSITEARNGTASCHVFGRLEQECVSLEAAQLLRLCYSSGTIDQLMARAAKDPQLSLKDQQSVREELFALVQRRLLVPLSRLFREDLEVSTPDGLLTIAIPTADRPESLVRTVRSVMHCEASHNRNFTISICDDSRTLADRVLRDLLLEIKRDHPGRPLRFSTPSTRKMYCERMVTLGIERPAAEFALLGIDLPGITTVGAVRNSILLDTLGQNVLCVDDDVIFNRVYIPPRRQSIVFCGHRIPWRPRFFKTRFDLVAEMKPSSAFDLMGTHIEVLGYSFNRLARYPEGTSIGAYDLCPHMLKAILSNELNRILVTSSGLLGDAASHTPSRWLTSEESWAALLREDGRVLEMALHDREVLVSVEDLVVTHSPHVQSYCLGLANKYPLPPFLPVGRNEEGFFGMLIQNLCAGSIAHLPHAVFHAPQEARGYVKVTQFRLSEMLIGLLTLLLARPGQALGHDLEAAGRNMIQLDRPGHAQLVDHLIEIRRLRIKSATQHIDSLLASFEGCRLWRTELVNLRAHYVSELNDFLAIFPSEIKQSGSISEILGVTGLLVRRVGELLCNWRHLRTAASILDQREIRSTVSVLA